MPFERNDFINSARVDHVRILICPYIDNYTVQYNKLQYDVVKPDVPLLQLRV